MEFLCMIGYNKTFEQLILVHCKTVELMITISETLTTAIEVRQSQMCEMISCQYAEYVTSVVLIRLALV